MSLVLADRDEAALDRVVATLPEATPVVAAVVDVASVDDNERLVALAEELGGLRLSVLNAGVYLPGLSWEVPLEQWQLQVDVNQWGVIHGVRAAVPAMIEHGEGHVVAMASGAGLVATPALAPYVATKHAVVGLTRALALDHSATGVRFNAICPGRVETPFVRARIADYPDPEQAYREMASTQLNGRMIRPAEVAAAALYLASDESAMVTGSCQMIDGGWSAGK